MPGPRGLATAVSVLAAAASIALPSAHASATFSDGTENYVCGTPDLPDPLAKTAELPRITKVYSGKSVAVMVRIAFSDQPYTVAESTITKTHNAINVLYRSMSRNTFEFDFKIHPEVWTAPGTGASYVTNFSSLQSFVTTKMREAGYVKGTNYTVFVASFPRIGLSWAGLSNGPNSGANYINGSYSSGVTAHELGHAVGLPHAHSIEAGTDPFGVPGTSSQHVEYGNPYDVMGNAGGMGHFNVNYKWRTGWLDANEALEVKTSGVYRLYAQDNAVHKGRLLGIRVPSGDARYAYWFEYRSAISSARLGTVVLFEGFQTTTNRGIHILDMTPASRTSGDAQDGILAVGKDFKDKYGTATFKTLAINNNVWTEEGWVDLEVTIPGTVMARFDRPAAYAKALRPGNARVVDLMGRTLGNALPAKILILKGDAGYTMTTSSDVFKAMQAR